MTIRREPTYLSTEVWRALWILAKAKTPEEGDPGRIVTADQMADEMLANLIVEKYPQLTAHLKAVQKMERDLIKTL